MSWEPNMLPVKVNACITEMIKEFKMNEILISTNKPVCSNNLRNF